MDLAPRLTRRRAGSARHRVPGVPANLPQRALRLPALLRPGRRRGRGHRCRLGGLPPEATGHALLQPVCPRRGGCGAAGRCPAAALPKSLSWVKKHRVWSKLRARGNDATPARAQLRPNTQEFYLRQRYTGAHENDFTTHGYACRPSQAAFHSPLGFSRIVISENNIGTSLAASKFSVEWMDGRTKRQANGNGTVGRPGPARARAASIVACARGPLFSTAIGCEACYQ